MITEKDVLSCLDARCRTAEETGVVVQVLHAELRMVLNATDRLQAIVDKMPTTADGVPITPDMRVYYHDYREGGERIIWAVVRQVSKNGWVDAPHFIRDGSRLLWSSEELAAKHLAEVKQEEADRYTREAAEEAIAKDVNSS